MRWHSLTCTVCTTTETNNAGPWQFTATAAATAAESATPGRVFQFALRLDQRVEKKGKKKTTTTTRPLSLVAGSAAAAV